MQLSDQPFYILNDQSYDSMLSKLRAGSPYEKSYLGKCPHRNPANCNCLFFKNTLHKCACADHCICAFPNDTIVRKINGVTKPVFAQRDLLSAMYDDPRFSIDVMSNK